MKRLEAGDIDTYIEESASAFVSQLEQHSIEGTLFFNQVITPEVACVVREGDTLYKTKIPYRASSTSTCWKRRSMATTDVVSPSVCRRTRN